FTLAEDSGLVVDELGGAPGIYSARFSVPNASDERNIEKVLSLLKNTPFEKRTARFVCSMVLASQERVLTEITEKVEGYITFEQKGRWGFGYDPIFYYPPLDKTLAELEPEVKNKVSHRGRALTKLREFLKNYLK
ncbi:MAG: non-canonical purine NTP pyrophosphatase, partial [Acidobacteriota bacterium]